MRLELGCPVRCSDELFGELADVVVDPNRKRVTHLVVQPRHQHRLARLVPVELVAGSDEAVRPELLLRATVAEVRRLEPVWEFAYLRLGEFPVRDPDWDIGVEDVLALPYYDAIGIDRLPPVDEPNVGVSYDRVPKGEVEIRRASDVSSREGHHLGRVDGFLVDAADRITHLVLDQGHLWGRREVTIPVAAVAKVETDRVTLSLSEDEVGALEPVPVHRWPSSLRERMG
jgi:sporulation protein YlmC with PRC-barrel domain